MHGIVVGANMFSIFFTPSVVEQTMFCRRCFDDCAYGVFPRKARYALIVGTGQAENKSLKQLSETFPAE